MNVLGFDGKCAERFQLLFKQRLRVGTMDLRIAATALVHDLTVLTRNTVDFERVPGLRVETGSTDRIRQSGRDSPC